MLHFADDAPVVMRTHVRTEKCMGVGRELGTAADKKNLEHSYTFLMPDSWRLSSFLCTIFSRIYTIKACKLEGKVLEANSPRMCEKRKITATTICCSTDKDIALMSIALGEIEGRRTYEECESSAVIIFCALLFPFDDSRLKKMPHPFCTYLYVYVPSGANLLADVLQTSGQIQQFWQAHWMVCRQRIFLLVKSTSMAATRTRVIGPHPALTVFAYIPKHHYLGIHTM